MLRPLRVAVLCSRRCPGAADLLADRRRGWRWQLTGVLTSEEDMADRPLFAAAGVPVLSHPIRDFYRRRGRPLSDLATRREYDEEVARALSPFQADLLLLSGYLYIATEQLLDAFGRRIVNVHGSDLTRADANGRPKYPGLRAVRDAIFAGEFETRATAHWVTEELDMGPPIVRSRAFPVSPLVPDALARGDVRALKAYAFAHQEWMLAEAWGPLWTTVIGLAGASRITPPNRAPSAPSRFAAQEVSAWLRFAARGVSLWEEPRAAGAGASAGPGERRARIRAKPRAGAQQAPTRARATS
jgi:folate-dependent phosphoribosylglycinamide formyltransferase PurN